MGVEKLLMWVWLFGQKEPSPHVYTIQTYPRVIRVNLHMYNTTFERKRYIVIYWRYFTGRCPDRTRAASCSRIWIFPLPVRTPARYPWTCPYTRSPLRPRTCSLYVSIIRRLPVSVDETGNLLRGTPTHRTVWTNRIDLTVLSAGSPALQFASSVAHPALAFYRVLESSFGTRLPSNRFWI